MDETLDVARERFRLVGRAAMGIEASSDGVRESMLTGMRKAGVGPYPFIALGLLVVADRFQLAGLLILGPEVTRALGVSKNALAACLLLQGLVLSLSALPMSALTQRVPRRGQIAILTGFAWSLMTLLTGVITNIWGLLMVIVGNGASGGSVAAVHQPLIADTYPPAVRVRVLSAYQLFVSAGAIVSPLVVGVFAGWLSFTWRGVFIVLGLLALTASILSLRLKDPGFGRFDVQRLRESVREESGPNPVPREDPGLSLGFFEIARRLLMIPTLRRIFAAYAVLGMLLVPLYTYFTFFLALRWRMDPGQRGWFFGVMPFFAITFLIVFSKRAEGFYRGDPARLFKASGGLQLVGIVALALAVVAPNMAVLVLGFGLGTAMFAALDPMLATGMLSIVEPHMRPHAAALRGVFMTGVGGIGGLFLLSSLQSQYGSKGALLAVSIPGLISALIVWRTAGTVNADMDRMIDEVVEDEELRGASSRGVHLPMLSCRRIEFSYGQVQVLFGVDFTAEEGEMVALLGTNGAGKSTLLRVISGLGLPSMGRVRFEGKDITFLDAARRVRLGILQVPGGRAVFPPLTVVEHLRAAGYTYGRDKRSIMRGIDESFAAFPRLEERRNQAAGQLSGGEQQMLALSKVFLLKPRLLLIDELSLGLAPKLVGELLPMVRRINSEGTAVVLVEQSVNIALSLVEHAYFMEKGQIRFDGRAKDLIGREDLLRSVFLAGATGNGSKSRPSASAGRKQRGARAEPAWAGRSLRQKGDK